MNKDELRREEISKGRKIFAAVKLSLLVIFILVVPAVIYAVYGSYIFTESFADDLVTYLYAHRSVSFWIICFLQIAQVVICVLPGQPIQFASSYLFGIPMALVVSLVGAAIGTLVSFYAADFLGRDAMHIIFGEDKISYYRNKLNSSKGILLVFLIYLIPGIPKDLTSYAAGISEMRFRPFLAASMLGRTPNMFGSILFGYFYRERNYIALIILAVLVGAVLLLCFLKRKEIMDFIDRIEQSGS